MVINVMITAVNGVFVKILNKGINMDIHRIEGLVDDILAVFKSYHLKVQHINIDIGKDGYLYNIFFEKNIFWWLWNYRKIKQAIDRITPKSITINLKRTNSKRS